MAVKFKHVNFTYSPKSPFEHDALFDINLEIDKNSFTAVIGHTGSGKSTLIQHINALLLPTNGVVNVNETLITPIRFRKYRRYLEKTIKNKKKTNEQKEIARNLLDEINNFNPYKKKKLRSEVGIVFQFPEYQLFEETVLKDVSFGPRNFGKTKEEAINLAKEALNRVGIDETYYERSPFELSGGEKRRVAIAGILAMKPSILILDEPTAGLDPLSSLKMMELFFEIYRQGITIILVSHDMNHVLNYATHVIVMRDGKVERKTTPRELFADLKGEDVISLPPLYKFMHDLVDRGCPLKIDKINNEKDLARAIKGLKGNA